jgi:hypothetical protein
MSVKSRGPGHHPGISVACGAWMWKKVLKVTEGAGEVGGREPGEQRS